MFGSTVEPAYKNHLYSETTCMRSMGWSLYTSMTTSAELKCVYATVHAYNLPCESFHTEILY